MRTMKDSDYAQNVHTSVSIDRTLAGHHNHVNLHNFRKTQNLTLRLNQRPQRLDHMAHKKRNAGYSVQSTNVQSKTAPTSAQLGNEMGGSQL